jgi:hypothetical protein
MEEGDHHNVDDDFFGDEDGSGGDDDVAYHRAMGERNYNRLHAIHATVLFIYLFIALHGLPPRGRPTASALTRERGGGQAGFREGVGEASEDEVVQAGFNAGFREGAAVAFRRSLQRALFTCVSPAVPLASCACVRA